MIFTFFSKNKKLIYLNLLISLVEPFALGILADHIGDYNLFGKVSLINLIIILPLLLLSLNFLIPVKKKEFSYLILFLFTGLGLMLGNLSDYAVWGATTGKLLHPDWETLIVLQLLVIYHFFLLAGLLLIIIIGKGFIYLGRTFIRYK